jgi:hypothetical protein
MADLHDDDRRPDPSHRVQGHNRTQYGASNRSVGRYLDGRTSSRLYGLEERVAAIEERLGMEAGSALPATVT